MRDEEKFYRQYLQRCNEHQFGELGEFVASDVRGGGAVQGLAAYVAGLQSMVTAFPDYQWDLQHLLVDGDWLAARLIGTGTHTREFLDIPATGRFITVQEFAIYQTASGKIVNCWGNLDTAVRAQIT